MSRIILAIAILTASVVNAQVQASVSQVGPTINSYFTTANGSSVQNTNWTFTITDTPANLLNSVPAAFNQVSTSVPTDATIIASAMSSIADKLKAAQAAAPNNLVIVAVSRDVGTSAVSYSVMTIW